MKTQKSNQSFSGWSSFWRSRLFVGMSAIVIFVLLLGLMGLKTNHTADDKLDKLVTPTPQSTNIGDLKVEVGDNVGLGANSSSIGLQGGSTDSTTTAQGPSSSQAIQSPQSPQALQNSQTFQGGNPSAQ
jgi:hypothetical protein